VIASFIQYRDPAGHADEQVGGEHADDRPQED